ncbi:MAG: hypothetical protein AAF737_00985 [Pseudomonadota bacterium]
MNSKAPNPTNGPRYDARNPADKAKRAGDHEAEAAAARRDLERVGEQSEVLGTSSFARVAGRARDHMLGADAPDQEDWAEVWGRRIGRTLGLLFAAYLVWWLLTFLTRGA